MKIDSIVKQVFGKLKIVGATDGTLIGNVSDAAKINLSSVTSGVIVTTIDTAHQRIHNGTGYHFSDFFTLNGGETRRYLITTGAKTLHAIWAYYTNGEIVKRFYESPTGVTTSTTFTLYNLNRSSANTCSSTIKLVTAYSTLGTNLSTTGVGVSGGGAASTEVTTREHEWILKASTDYIIEVASNNNNNNITFHLTGYETS